MCKSTDSTSPRRGFSLLELVLVLTILAVVSAIALPRYARSLERYRVEAAANRIIADLAYARSRARATSSAKTVEFDLTGDRYTLLGVADPDHGTAPYEVDLTLEPYAATLDAASFTDPITGLDPEDVVFDGYGIPDSGGELTISAGAESRTIELDEQTGQARVK